MRKIIILPVLLAAAAGGWWAFAPGGSKAPAPVAAGGPQSAASVEAVKVTTGPMAREITAVGTLRSDESVMIRPEIAGRIRSFNFDEGQRVAKGQTLVRLDDSSLAADFQQAQANLALSRANADRAVSLAARGAGTERARDEAEATLKVNQARIEQARAQLDKTHIIAPFAGIVGLRSVSVGAYVQPGQDIVNLEAIDLMKVDFRVPEVFLPVVRPGLSIALTADAYGGREFKGIVYAMDPAVDVNGRAVLVRARVENLDGLLRPGQFVRLVLKVDETLNAVSIPEESLVPRGDKVLVYRVIDGKAQPTPVKTGKRQKGMVEITEGLSEGDVVVTAGHMKLKPGAPVTIVNTPPAS